jgi:GrpB-like predicted nucleotidyltransferase (UPF0157 family)
MERLERALGPVLCAGVHAVGSTAVDGLAAKPILDLMPVVADLTLLDEAVPILERLGSRGWGELGIAGRRCFTKDNEAGQRVPQLHCFAQGSPHVERHLAFRDYLRAHPAIATAYQSEKLRCAALHPLDSRAYSDCKADWSLGWRRRRCGGIGVETWLVLGMGDEVLGCRRPRGPRSLRQLLVLGLGQER